MNDTFSGISLFWVYLIGILTTGLLPLVVLVATEAPLLSLAVLVVTALAIAGGIARLTIRRLNHMATVAQTIEEAINSGSQLPDIEQMLPGGGVREVHQLAQRLRQSLVALDRQISQLNSLYAISQTITSSTLDYEKTVKAVLAAVQKVVDYDAAEVAILRGEHLVVEAWWGKDGFKDTTGRRYRLGSGPTGSIAESKQTIYLPTVSESTQDLQRTIGYASVESEFLMKTTKLVINSFMGIPLLINDRLIGTLTLVHHEKGYFSPDDKRQLQRLADQASIAIDNALKFRAREELLQKQIAELRFAIDEDKRVAEVQEITESEYFQQLKNNAQRMRKRAYEQTGQFPAVRAEDLAPPQSSHDEADTRSESQT